MVHLPPHARRYVRAWERACSCTSRARLYCTDCTLEIGLQNTIAPISMMTWGQFMLVTGFQKNQIANKHEVRFRGIWRARAGGGGTRGRWVRHRSRDHHNDDLLHQIGGAYISEAN